MRLRPWGLVKDVVAGDLIGLARGSGPSAPSVHRLAIRASGPSGPLAGTLLVGDWCFACVVGALGLLDVVGFLGITFLLFVDCRLLLVAPALPGV